MFRLRRRRRKAAGELGLLERMMFGVMGPPQLGHPDAPSTVARDPAADLCHKCAQPWDEHEIVRTGSMTYARCPQTPRATEG